MRAVEMLPEERMCQMLSSKLKHLRFCFVLVNDIFVSFLKSPLHWSPSAVILEPKKINSVIVSIVSLSISREVMGPDAMIFVF